MRCCHGGVAGGVSCKPIPMFEETDRKKQKEGERDREKEIKM